MAHVPEPPLGHNLLLGEGVVRVGAAMRRSAPTWWCTPDTVIGAGCFIQDGAVLGKVPSLSPTSAAERGELPIRWSSVAGCVISTGAVVYRGTDARGRLRRRRQRGRARALQDRRRGDDRPLASRSRTTLRSASTSGAVRGLYHGVRVDRGRLLHRADGRDHQRQLHGSHRGEVQVHQGLHHPPGRAGRRRSTSCRASRSARRRS